MMCKFQVGDYVRVIDPKEHHFDEVGMVTDRDPSFTVCYRVKFWSELNAYYPAAALTLAPSPKEFS